MVYMLEKRDIEITQSPTLVPSPFFFLLLGVGACALPGIGPACWAVRVGGAGLGGLLVGWFWYPAGGGRICVGGSGGGTLTGGGGGGKDGGVRLPCA